MKAVLQKILPGYELKIYIYFTGSCSI